MAPGYDAQPVTAERVAGLPVLDRYLLARTHDLVERVTADLDAFDIAAACEGVREHLDMLTNWYVRTQRDRFWSEDADAFDTLFTALETLTRRDGAARADGGRGGLARADRRALACT